jgi:transposase-like protein
MTTADRFPQTLMAAVMYFADPDRCHEYMKSIKWPDGRISCPQCSSLEIGGIKSRRMFQCKAKGCRKQFSVKVGTIFEDSPLPLQKWFVAVWSITNAKNGISSCELARAIGVTQKSAWFMLHRVRLAMKTGTFQRIKGEVEADETFIGGLSKNMHKRRRERTITGTGGAGKTAVLGILQRTSEEESSRATAKVVQNTRGETLQPEIRKSVEPGSTLYTDAWASYRGLSDKYTHEVIDHAVEYVRDNVHTNGIENFWSLLKRTLRGTYVHVDPEHLDRYLDEQALRFNERKVNDRQRFGTVMGRVPGRRITYASLTGSRRLS